MAKNIHLGVQKHGNYIKTKFIIIRIFIIWKRENPIMHLSFYVNIIYLVYWIIYT